MSPSLAGADASVLGWWPWVLSLGILVGAVSVVLRQRVSRRRQVEQLRESIAADLHDDLGSTLSSLSILSELARTASIQDPARLPGLLERIRDDSRMMIETMDDIVWSIRPEGDELNQVLARLRRVGSEILEPAGVSFLLETSGDPTTRLGMATRRNLFLVFKEAVTNAAVHSRCGTVRATLESGNRVVLLEVSDDGQGFEVARIQEGDGLGNMRHRAQNMGGVLEIDAAPGRGTTVRISLPAGSGEVP